MNRKQDTETSFTQDQAFHTIHEMIQVSKQRMKNDGILFILWGWTYFITLFLLNFIPSILVTTPPIMDTVRFLRWVLPLVALLLTILYLYKRRKQVKTYASITLRTIWITLLFTMVAVNLIHFNVLGATNFELQHPIFMVLIAFAIIITGSIIRYNLVVIGGIVFGLLAYLSSHFAIQTQLLIEACAWLVAFVIPGHLLYASRKKNNHA